MAAPRAKNPLAFQHGLESWARYPCALNANETNAEQNLSPPLWAGYLGLMHAYGKALMLLLQHGWDGPHGAGGYFEFLGAGYLGAQPNNSLSPKSVRPKSGNR